MEETDHHTHHDLFGEFKTKHETPRCHSPFKEVFGLLLVFSLSCFATTVLFGWLAAGMPLESSIGKSVNEKVTNTHNYLEPVFTKLKVSK